LSLCGKIGRGAVLAIGLGALSACVNIGGGKAPDHLYGLNTVPVAGDAVSAVPAEALILVEPDVDHALAVTRVAVAVPGGGVAYMKDGAWIDRPARLFRDRLADTIRAKTKRIVVFEDAETPAGAQRLSGRLASFGYDAATHTAVVRYDALRRGRDGVLAQRRFEASEPVAKPKVALVVTALGVASGKVAGQVADWVK
jgi:cholesterol transport system auxiliary component